jgi:hypothetical protein
VFKLPWQIANQLINGTFSIEQTIKTLLAKSDSPQPTLLAQADSEESLSLEDQAIIDAEVVETITLLNQQQDATSCLQIGNIYSTEELDEGLQEIR